MAVSDLVLFIFSFSEIVLYFCLELFDFDFLFFYTMFGCQENRKPKRKAGKNWNINMCN